MKLSLACSMVVLFARISFSCGIDWSEPRCRIEGCNEQGYVLISEKLAELNVPGEKEPIPIWATFDSSRQTPSLYAGMGWRIAFLESSLVQLSEDEFQLTEPGGWKRLFRRAAKGSDLLDGGGGWKGQLLVDRAILWANCGWRIDFYRGKIVQLKTPHDQIISFKYINGRISSVVCGPKTLISIDPEDGPNHILNMTLGGENYSIIKAEQPRVQRIVRANLITANDWSFSQLKGPGTASRTFTYEVDDQTRPMITIAGRAKNDIVITWDPETRRIAKNGEWTYDIKPSDQMMENASIGRTNANGQREFWFYDGIKGQETEQEKDGTKRITTRFTSGAASGKIRGVEVEKNGVNNPEIQNSYDEDGQIIRSIKTTQTPTRSVQTTKYFYSKRETDLPKPQLEAVKKYINLDSLAFIKASSNDNVNWEYAFIDKDGYQIGLIKRNNHIDYTKRKKSFHEIYIDEKLSRTKEFYPDGRIKEEKFYSYDGKTLEQVQHREYNDAARTETITLLSNNEGFAIPRILVIKHDDIGRVIKYQTTEGDTYKYSYDLYGNRNEITSN